MIDISYRNSLDHDLHHLLDDAGKSGFSEAGGVRVIKRLALSDVAAGAYLYQANCLEIMDKIISKHPAGCFDMIFADPPYFLSNGGITCQAGKMVKVDKGKWDKSPIH